MRLQFKHQKFQQDATNAVCDIFAGQPYSAFRYKIDSGKGLDFMNRDGKTEKLN